MKHIFLDTNIIIDIFAARAPYDIAAIELYRLAKDNKIKIYISAESFTTIYYILRINKIAHNKCLMIFQDLLKTTTVMTTNELIISKAVQIGFDDFEDGVQFISAKSNSKINLIVTRDKKGFKKSDIAIADANQAMQFIAKS
jgi:predicted nucleic acid-binding protein